MRMIYVLVVFLVACAAVIPESPAVPLKVDDVVVRQCRMPIPFIVSKDVDDEFRQTIIDGFEYWNRVLKREIFVYLGSFDVDARLIYGDVLTISMVKDQTELQETYPDLKGTNRVFIALSIFRRVKHCMTNARILFVQSEVDTLNAARKLTVTRHEAGHILGLADNPDSNSVMYGYNDVEIEKPRKPLKEELKLLRQYYRHLPKR